jgi:hypothetical protein
VADIWLSRSSAPLPTYAGASSVFPLSCHFSTIASIPSWVSDLVFFNKFREEPRTDEFGGLLYDGLPICGHQEDHDFPGFAPDPCV